MAECHLDQNRTYFSLTVKHCQPFSPQLGRELVSIEQIDISRTTSDMPKKSSSILGKDGRYLSSISWDIFYKWE